MRNRIAEYFQNRIQRKIFVVTTVFGSCHTLVKPRHRWSPLRFLCGPISISLVHPMSHICTCRW